MEDFAIAFNLIMKEEECEEYVNVNYLECRSILVKLFMSKKTVFGILSNNYDGTFLLI